MLPPFSTMQGSNIRANLKASVTMNPVCQFPLLLHDSLWHLITIHIKVSPLSSLLRESGSIQIRSLVSTSAASFHSVPDSLLKSSGSEGEQQTMPPPVTHETPPLTSSASQDGSPEVETHEANVIPVRVDEASFAHLNYTAMTTPEPPGAWTITPDPPLKHAPRATSPLLVSASELTPITSSLSSSWTPPSLSRANSGPERRSKPETPAGNDLFTPKHPQALLCTKPLHVRTSAPRGAWMSTTTQNWSNKQSKFGSIRTKKNILKVRFDVAESEASTTEVEHQVSPITDMPTSTPDSLFNSHASRSGNVTQTRINGFSQDDVVDNPVLARPVTSRRPMTPTSHANAPSSRPQRKAFIVKVVDAFGRERIDELLIPIANGRADVRDTICASPSAKSFTPRVSSKNEIRIIDATGEVQEDVSECSSVLHDNPPICRTAALVQIRKKLREWVSGLSDEDR
jgi:serine/arginine repetitive matrix protein 2